MRARSNNPAGSARSLAMRHVARCVRRYPDLPIEPPDTSGLDARDAALAHAIVDGVVSRWLTLEPLLARFVRQGWSALEPDLRACLLVAGAQVLFFDRVPIHAAIDESVELAKTRIRPGAGALANAVLRRLADLVGARETRPSWADRPDELPLADGRALVLRDRPWPSDERERLAIASSHPREALDLLVGAAAPKEARRVALHSIVAAPTIVCVEHDPTIGPADPWLAPHESPGHRVFLGTRDELVGWLGRHRRAWVQDPGSSAGVREASDLRPRRVLDLCAGKGTKTRQLALQFPDALVVATDVDDARRATLRAGVGGDLANVRVVEPGDRLEQADLVVLDVPCSNSGVLARRREAKYRLSRASVGALVETQRAILERARPLVAPGGRVLYSTCSLCAAENEGVVRWASERVGLRVERSWSRAPEGVPGDPASRYRDGSYAALLVG